MPFANINNAQIYYEVTGAGQPLVFIHSGIADSRMWDAQVAFFSKNYQVLRYDLRGFGQTPTYRRRIFQHRGFTRAFGSRRNRLLLLGGMLYGRQYRNGFYAFSSRPSKSVGHGGIGAKWL